MKKFIQTLNEGIYAQLKELADDRGISVQELLRALIIPEWLSKQDLSIMAKVRKVNEGFAGPGVLGKSKKK